MKIELENELDIVIAPFRKNAQKETIKKRIEMYLMLAHLPCYFYNKAKRIYFASKIKEQRSLLFEI